MRVRPSHAPLAAIVFVTLVLSLISGNVLAGMVTIAGVLSVFRVLQTAGAEPALNATVLWLVVVAASWTGRLPLILLATVGAGLAYAVWKRCAKTE